MAFFRRSFLGWGITVSYLAAVVLGLVAINLNFFPAPLWALATCFVALLPAWRCLPRVFSERARTSIINSANPALLRKGQMTLGCLLFSTLWLGWWSGLCQAGGSLFTIAAGASYAQTLDGHLSSHLRGTVRCRYEVWVTAVPNHWGHALCVPSRFYNSMPQRLRLRLVGARSVLGFKVTSYSPDSRPESLPGQ